MPFLRDLFLGNNIYGAAFVKLYDEFRGKWKRQRYESDGLMTPGLPENAYSSRGLLSSLPWFYEDMKIDGATNRLEILLKKRRIDPLFVRYLK